MPDTQDLQSHAIPGAQAKSQDKGWVMDKELGDEQWGLIAPLLPKLEVKVDLGLLKAVDQVRVP